MPGGFNPPQDVVDSWPEPNFTNPETRRTELIAGILTVTITSSIVLTLRLYSRLFIVRNPGLDDAFIVLAALLAIALTVVVTQALCNYGWNLHIWDNRPENLETSFLLEWIGEQLRMPCLYLIKVSVLLFYKRILCRLSSKKFNWVINGSIIYIVITSLTFDLLYFFRCLPVSAYWTRFSLSPPSADEYACNVDEGLVNVLSTVNCTLTNLLVTTIPLFFLHHLKIRQSQKIEFAILISLGYFVCVTSVVRLAYVIIIHYRSYDVFWFYGWSWAWMLVEIHVGIMVASAPALKPLYSRVLPTTPTFATRLREKFSAVYSRSTLTSSSSRKEKAVSFPENSIKSTMTFDVVVSKA